MNERQLAKLKALHEATSGKGNQNRFGKLKDGISMWRFIPYGTDEDGDPNHF